MVFNTLETGSESGQPIELYTFRLGNGTPTRYTSSQNEVTLTTTLEVFTPVAIERGNLVEELNNPNTNRLQITLPAGDDWVAQFRNIAPGQRATITIRRLHRADLGGSEDTITIFKGTVRNVSFSKNGRQAVLQVLPITSAMSRPMPRRTYQNLCNHMLYDSRCGILENDPNFRLSNALVTAVSGDVITVTGAAAFDALADFFEGGFITFGDDYRTVVAQSGDNLTVITPFLSSPDGELVSVNAGCKHRVTTDCLNKFNNLSNYGGFPYVPTKNPFATGLD